MDFRSKSNAAVGVGDVVQELIRVFANEGFFVIAGDVVPGDAIVVNVVEDGQAGFGGLVDVEFSVVGLRDFLVSCLGPGVEAPLGRNFVGGRHLGAVRRPEPAKDRLGHEVGSVLAALEVAEATRCPDVWHVVCKEES